MNQIKSERTRLGITQEDLAGKLGVTNRTVVNWEKGDPMSASYLVGMADLFGCSTDYLLGRTDERLLHS